MVVSFFGAGASAPFGIPTMQAMVPMFEGQLQTRGTKEELALYTDICSFLKSTLGRPTDLEAVFTIVDSIIDWSPERMGVAALYHATKATEAAVLSPLEHALILKVDKPSPDVSSTAKTLRGHFEAFVQQACSISDGQSQKIETVYDAFFRALSSLGGTHMGGRKKGYVGIGAMFTTNYDAVLEHFWLDFAEANLETGFAYDDVSRMSLSQPERFGQTQGYRLFKLHGSITWLEDPRYGLTEHPEPPHEMRTFTGRKFRGQVMLYPIEEKILYTEPYLTMYQMLNRELAGDPNWVVVGYSFGDRVIRDIFLRNSKEQSRLVLLHPRASEIAKRLEGFRGRVKSLNMKFGEGDIQKFTLDMTNALRA